MQLNTKSKKRKVSNSIRNLKKSSLKLIPKFKKSSMEFNSKKLCFFKIFYTFIVFDHSYYMSFIFLCHLFYSKNVNLLCFLLTLAILIMPIKFFFLPFRNLIKTIIEFFPPNLSCSADMKTMQLIGKTNQLNF